MNKIIDGILVLDWLLKKRGTSIETSKWSVDSGLTDTIREEYSKEYKSPGTKIPSILEWERLVSENIELVSLLFWALHSSNWVYIYQIQIYTRLVLFLSFILCHLLVSNQYFRLLNLFSWPIFFHIVHRSLLYFLTSR